MATKAISYYTEMTARGETPKGASGVETMVPARAFVQGLETRGIHVSSRVVPAQSAAASV